MDQTISCPACKATITLNHLLRTLTLVRFKCPHCAARVQPKDKTFAIGWLVVAAAVGALGGVAAVIIDRLVPDGVPRVLAYIGLVVLGVGAVAIIKWRASLGLIKKTELEIAP